MSHHFQVIRLWEQPTEIFLQTLGLLPLAVLSNTANQTNTLREVATIINNVGEKQMQSNLATTTFVLAGLVLEEEVIQRLLRRNIMRESVTYQSIVTENCEEGREEGLAVELLFR
jgi:predicted transposase YdaD